MAGRRGAGEGTVSRRLDGRWEARLDLGWENGKRKRKSIYGRTHAEVAFKLNEALATTRLLVDEQQQLGSWLDRWLSELVEPRVRRSTFVSYRTIVKRHLRPALGKQRLAKLTPEALLRYMEGKRAEGLSARTIQYHHAVLRKALSDAERLGIVARNVARLVSAPGPQRPEVEALTQDRAREILRAVEADRIEVIVQMALLLGLRQGELLGLRWDDVDIEAERVTVRQSLARDPEAPDGWLIDGVKVTAIA